MRFRIPPQMKETVTIVRQDAFNRNTRIDIATANCMVLPQSDAIRVVDGVARAGTGWRALLETPNDAIHEGDILKRADKTEFTVYRVRQLGGTMILELRDENIP